MDYASESLKRHREWQGKIEVVCRVPLKTKEDLSLAYTPGVAQPCLEIQKNPDESFNLTRRHNTVAVITDGSAVLGLGNIGGVAGMPVMEGKCALFKAFGDVDAIPLCVNSNDPDEIVRTVSLISGSFGGINLEDISAPRCFEIEQRLQECCDIPVFHDDQHGTAVVVLAALLNALKVVGKNIGDCRAVVSGAGAAGTAIVKLLLESGLQDIIMCDKPGAVCEGEDWMTAPQAEMAKRTNREKRHGSLADVLVGADIFIGVSAPGLVTKEMVSTMAKDAIIFSMANPVPEIYPEDAKAGGAAVVGSGRSDYPNQINNVLAFPGIFRGALDVRAREINAPMKLAAAKAIASYLPESEISAENIIPTVLDRGVSIAVAKAVAEAARASGAARC